MHIQANTNATAANSAKTISAAQPKVAATTANAAAKPAVGADKVSISPEALARQAADNAQ